MNNSSMWDIIWYSNILLHTLKPRDEAKIRKKHEADEKGLYSVVYLCINQGH